MIRQDAVDSLTSKAYMGYSEPRQASRMECFEKTLSLTIFEENSNLHVWQNCKYVLGSVHARELNIPRF